MRSTKRGSRLLLDALLLGLGFIAVSGGSGPAMAKDKSPECSNATLKGSYGHWEQGTWLVPIPGLPTPPFAYASVGTSVYDGNGNVTTIATASAYGYPIQLAFTGTYAVAPDCTTSMQLKDTGSGNVAYYSGTITGTGMQQEVRFTYVSGNSTLAAALAVGTARKMPVGGCSLATLEGDYGLSGQWIITVPVPFPGYPPPPLYGTQVGVLTADGAGNISGSDTQNRMGLTVTTAFDATYSVERSCVVSYHITGTASDTTTYDLEASGVITGEGSSQEVHSLVTTPGWVYLFTMKKQ